MEPVQIPTFCKCPKCQMKGWNVFTVTERLDGTIVRRLWCKECGFEWREWPDPEPRNEEPIGDTV